MPFYSYHFCIMHKKDCDFDFFLGRVCGRARPQERRPVNLMMLESRWEMRQEENEPICRGNVLRVGQDRS